MGKYKLMLDESGVFDSLIDRYIIIGGLFFSEDDETELEKIFIPLQEHICNALSINELHGKVKKKIYNYVAPIIGATDTLHPVILVIDKYKSFIFRKYDKKSFKYNKAIEHLIKKMLEDELLNSDDELIIKIDNISQNVADIENLKTYLPRQFDFVKEVCQVDSRDNVFIQLADVIVNRFSKKPSSCETNSTEMKLLNPKIYCFLNETADEYFVE